MNEFLLEFTEFMGVLRIQLNELLLWFLSTVIGKISLFMIIICLFLSIIKIIITLKD